MNVWVKRTKRGLIEYPKENYVYACSKDNGQGEWLSAWIFEGTPEEAKKVFEDFLEFARRDDWKFIQAISLQDINETFLRVEGEHWFAGDPQSEYSHYTIPIDKERAMKILKEIGGEENA